jgi:hypothetical protein
MGALGLRVEESAAPGTGTGHHHTLAAYLEVKDGSLGPEGGGVCCPLRVMIRLELRHK